MFARQLRLGAGLEDDFFLTAGRSDIFRLSIAGGDLAPVLASV